MSTVEIGLDALACPLIKYLRNACASVKQAFTYSNTTTAAAVYSVKHELYSCWHKRLRTYIGWTGVNRTSEARGLWYRISPYYSYLPGGTSSLNLLTVVVFRLDFLLCADVPTRWHGAHGNNFWVLPGTIQQNSSRPRVSGCNCCVCCLWLSF